MNTISIIKGYTDIEQSRKLAEFLLSESADMCYIQDLLAGCKYGEYKPYIGDLIPTYGQGKIKCWSLAALIELITKIQQGGIFYNLTYDFILNKWTMNIEADNWTEDIGLYDNPVDACYEMIVGLHGLNLL